MRQVALAREVGISASYLNLIEHDKRPIAGKLLADIARALDLEARDLAEGVGSELISELKAIARIQTGIQTGPKSGPQTGARAPGSTAASAGIGGGAVAPEGDRVDDFASRFPGWARAHLNAAHRIADLERTVETLSDRLTHDPHLSDALHEVLSVVTAIRSTSGILAGEGEIDPTWQRRFQTNLHEDARRLSESAAALVGYLDTAGDADKNLSAPQEELDTFFGRHGWHFPSLEVAAPPVATPQTRAGAPSGDPDGPAIRAQDAEAESAGSSLIRLVREAPEFSSEAVQTMAIAQLSQYQRDATALPLADFLSEAAPLNWDVLALVRGFGVPVDQVMRRMASLPPDSPGGRIGRISCDGSGSLTCRKPARGFPVPRFGGSCALWPLFEALAVGGPPIVRTLTQPMGGRGRHNGQGETYFAVACRQMDLPETLGHPARFRADMVLMPPELIADSRSGASAGATAGATAGGGDVLLVGSGCRICTVGHCEARREPSILSAATEVFPR